MHERSLSRLRICPTLLFIQAVGSPDSAGHVRLKEFFRIPPKRYSTERSSGKNLVWLPDAFCFNYVVCGATNLPLPFSAPPALGGAARAICRIFVKKYTFRM